MALAEAQIQDDQTGIPEWTFADRLAKARRHAGLRQKELAKALHTSTASISRWENGDRLPRDQVELARQYEAQTGVDAAWILGIRTGSFATLVPFTDHHLGQGSFDDLDWTLRPPALSAVT